MTKTIKELLDETIDARLKWVIKDTGADYESLVGLISQVEALVRKQTVDDIHKILFNNDSKGVNLVERYAKANNIII